MNQILLTSNEPDIIENASSTKYRTVNGYFQFSPRLENLVFHKPGLSDEVYAPYALTTALQVALDFAITFYEDVTRGAEHSLNALPSFMCSDSIPNHLK